MAKDKTYLDGFLTTEGGVDSGFAPSLIQPNQLAWAVNVTSRGGFPTARPGWWKRGLTFPNNDVQTLFSTGYFQGHGTYVSDGGVSFVAVAISGRTFLINVQTYAVQEITIPGDLNQVGQPHVWFQQAERWLVVQDGLSPAMLFDGATSRRADPETEVPTGSAMAYGKGRLWVAIGNEYVGGDAVYSDPALGRDCVIRFTENTFLNEGGKFGVPQGPITGMAFAANLDTSLGDGDLLVFTSQTAFAFNAPVDRTVWKDLTYPIQRFALIGVGGVNHESITMVNGDLVFRSSDGVRSLIYARRDFTEWGNTPISRQMQRAMAFDTYQLLYAASSVTFNNRVMMTSQPQMQAGRGVYHRALLVLDFDLVAGMGRKLPPAWEGVWTGLKMMAVRTVDTPQGQRGFIVALGSDGAFCLYEMTQTGAFDFDGAADRQISWIMETRSTTFSTPIDMKRLVTASFWYDQVMGNVSLVTRYRQNEAPCWNDWATFSDCAQYQNCNPGTPCKAVTYYRPPARSQIGLPMPPEQVDPSTGRFCHYGYEFQIRLEITGRLRLKRLMLAAEPVPEERYENMVESCVPGASVPCQSGCLTLECAGVCMEPPDYNYAI